MHNTFDPHRTQGRDPHVAKPLRCQADIVLPQRIGTANHDIDPKLCPGVEQHRPSPALTVEDIDIKSFRCIKVDIVD